MLIQFDSKTPVNKGVYGAYGLKSYGLQSGTRYAKDQETIDILKTFGCIPKTISIRPSVFIEGGNSNALECLSGTHHTLFKNSQGKDLLKDTTTPYEKYDIYPSSSTIDYTANKVVTLEVPIDATEIEFFIQAQYTSASSIRLHAIIAIDSIEIDDNSAILYEPNVYLSSSNLLIGDFTAQEALNIQKIEAMAINKRQTVDEKYFAYALSGKGEASQLIVKKADQVIQAPFSLQPQETISFEWDKKEVEYPEVYVPYIVLKKSSGTSASASFPLQEKIIEALDLPLQENIAGAGGTEALNLKETVYQGVLTDYIYPQGEQYPSDLPNCIDLTNTYNSTSTYTNDVIYISAMGDGITDQYGNAYIEFNTPQPNTRISFKVGCNGKSSSTLENASASVSLDNQVVYSKSGKELQYTYQVVTVALPSVGRHVLDFTSYCPKRNDGSTTNKGYTRLLIKEIHFPIIGIQGIGVSELNLKENSIEAGANDLALKETITESTAPVLYTYDCSEQYPSDLPNSINLDDLFYPGVTFSPNECIEYKAIYSKPTSASSLLKFTTTKPNQSVTFYMSIDFHNESGKNSGLIFFPDFDAGSHKESFTTPVEPHTYTFAEAGTHEMWLGAQIYSFEPDYLTVRVEKITFNDMFKPNTYYTHLVPVQETIDKKTEAVDTLELRENTQAKADNTLELQETIKAEDIDTLELQENIQSQEAEVSLLIIKAFIQAHETETLRLVQKVYDTMHHTLALLEKVSLKDYQNLLLKEEIEALINASMISLFEKTVDAGQYSLNLTEKIVLSEQLKLSLKEKVSAENDALLSLVERILEIQENLLLLSEKVSEKGASSVSIVEDISKLGLLLLKERVIATKPVSNNTGNTFFIPFNQEVIVYGKEVLDEATGDLTFGEGKLTQAYVAYEVSEITDFNGQQTFSNIKVYLPSNVSVNSKSKIELGEKTYSLKQFAIKKHLSGQIAYFICYL